MRCLACNKRLNERESTRKSATTGSYLDLCNHCFSTVAEDIPDIEEGDGYIDEFEEEEINGRDGVVDEWDYQQSVFGGRRNESE